MLLRLMVGVIASESDSTGGGGRRGVGNEPCEPTADFAGNNRSIFCHKITGTLAAAAPRHKMKDYRRKLGGTLDAAGNVT
jgi:hypothetical protein